ncbi:MAG: pyridoxal phosphate-dependent aminotransferase [Alphaproteobacteria bacterium]|jgi:cysteine-S-conjugate beta-lyase|nr:pyridoxal phosphate-dependent aminotransferase [Rhodospirillaceae bacterium]MBT6511354.1 pyridoxal phosphate-dependent aminotransferase [Rhodospirillaceae bacterium]MBT7613585.1 pyridoxal phosphate-dependent aminotransferase [Rhodospirillaceae bacterium]MBT7647900.1 pyridoxal phosphate-dependent aminotransferase [Rhodospirillaceae bacterium]MDG2480516.1 pyridoxal phosphate-dependent aminotransferase [Alphaproteobacteria bacterium]
MRFDFDRVIDRSGTYAAKWDHTMAAHGQPAPAELFAGEGPDPISMSVADMEFAAPPCVLEAMTERVQHGVMGYTMVSDDYREAVAAWQAERHGWSIEPDWVLTHHGVLPSLFLAIRAFLKPGDGIILQTPAFPPFFDTVTIHDCRVVINELQREGDRYVVDFEGFEKACAQPDVRMFILCNPHNPVGRCFDADELGRMLEICKRHDVMIFADEIHGDLIMPGNKLTPLLSLCDGTSPQVITGNGLSKTMNLAGLQLSNVIIPNETLRTAYAEASMEAGIWGMNPISKAGFIAGFREGGPWLDALLGYVAGNMAFTRDFCAERLPELSTIPIEGTYLQWFDMRDTSLDEETLMHRIQSKARLRVEAGSAFGDGGTGYVRINVACPRSVVVEAMERLERMFRAND